MSDVRDWQRAAGPFVAIVPSNLSAMIERARDRQRQELIDLLMGRAYRKLAWDKFLSALRFPDPAWREVQDIHLEHAITLERSAELFEGHGRRARK